MRALLPFTLGALLAVASSAAAQLVPQPGQVVDGKVVVKVQATLADDDVPYYPLARYDLRLFRTPTDSLVLRTDAAGELVFSIAPGDYRLVSAEPFDWRGKRYSWSLPLSVRSGMAVVDLSPRNAMVAPLVIASGVPVTSQAAVATPRPGVSPKDGTLGVVLSLLITGGGQMYAGKGGKGVALLLTGIGGLALSVTQSCGYYDDDAGCDDGLAPVGGIIFLSTWIYSMASAPGDVRQWNARQGFSVAVQPHVAPGAGGTTHVGLSLALPR